MRRIAITAALLVQRSPLPAAASAAPVGGARLLACDSALDPADRMATFEGRMRTARGATRLQMRFTLQTRSKDQANWPALPAPGFGKWLSSDPGVGRYVYTKRVVALFAPASYRTLVAFAGSGAAAGASPRTARPRPPAARPTCGPTCARSR